MATAPKDWESRIGRRLKLRDLHILSAVVQWGSMAKAAVHLSMTQPAVSDAIANLEDTLRVRLLDRSSRGVEPTIYASALLKRGLVVFDDDHPCQEAFGVHAHQNLDRAVVGALERIARLETVLEPPRLIRIEDL